MQVLRPLSNFFFFVLLSCNELPIYLSETALGFLDSVFSEWQQHDQLTNPQEDKGCDFKDQIIDPRCLSGNSSFVFLLNDLTCLFKLFFSQNTEFTRMSLFLDMDICFFHI